jgi:NAD(P)-dependent dehydrogenase (short-subunit alcohol dehydrogenase family)
MTVSYDFAGVVALVTGASSGMGLATARAFAESAAATVLADRNAELVQQEAQQLASHGYTVLPVVCDVTDEAQVEAMVRAAVDSFGRLDMAFNNAGIMIPTADAADEAVSCSSFSAAWRGRTSAGLDACAVRGRRPRLIWLVRDPQATLSDRTGAHDWRLPRAMTYVESRHDESVP